MPLSRKVRSFLALNKALQRAHLLPDIDRLVRMPVAKRLAIAPPKWAVGPSPEGVSTQDADVDGLPLRLYRPAAPHGGALLYLHGGGWSVGGFAGSDHICARIAADTGCVVLAVQYRLAPENVYPAALDDCHAALRWLHEHADDLGLDAARVAVAGDSAGGNLAAALTLRCRDQGPELCAQVLIYPALDATRSTPSAREYRGPGMTADDLAACWRIYLGGEATRDPLVSPLLADDLSGLPPALVITVEYDVLRDEGRRYAERLLEAGVPCRALHYDDYLHAVLSLPLLYEEVDAVWDEIAAFLRAATSNGPSPDDPARCQRIETGEQR